MDSNYHQTHKQTRHKKYNKNNNNNKTKAKYTCKKKKKKTLGEHMKKMKRIMSNTINKQQLN